MKKALMSALARSWVVASLLIAASTAGAGCRDETSSKPDLASATAPAEAQSSDDPAARNPDPVVTKTFRVDACYFGSMAFRQARRAYLGSLQGGEPGPGKIPEFGLAEDEPPASGATPGSSATPNAAPSASSGAKFKIAGPPDKPAAQPSAKPAGSASASAAPDKGKIPIDKNRRIQQVRYEYLARLCKTAAGIKSPDVPELDKVLDEYTTYELGLAKDLTDASMYYQKEESSADNFARGKELHTKIVSRFKELDDQQKKLADAVKAFETQNPINKAGYTESQQLSDALVQAAQVVLEDLDAEKIDATKAKADLAKLDGANDALSKHTPADKDAQDPFVLIVAPAGEREAKAAHVILDPAEVKTPKPSAMIAMASYFEEVLAGNYRATLKQLDPRSVPMNNPKIQVRPRLPNGHPMVPPQPIPQ
jgi:hypothetical protein